MGKIDIELAADVTAYGTVWGKGGACALRQNWTMTGLFDEVKTLSLLPITDI